MEADRIAEDVAEQVRQIVAQVERLAAQIIRDAERDAERIRAEAKNESQGQVQLVRGALDELQARLGSLPDALGPQGEVEPGPVTVPEPEPPLIPEPAPEPIPEPAPEPIPEPTPPPDEGTLPEAGSSTDAAAARLVAMNMALDGAAREEIEARLAEDYALPDAGAIVDDVLALAAK